MKVSRQTRGKKQKNITSTPLQSCTIERESHATKRGLNESEAIVRGAVNSGSKCVSGAVNSGKKRSNRDFS